MTDFIPLFPLKLVVFPGQKLNLHVFEPRYKQLIRECERNKITFGIPAFIDNKLMKIGTEMKLIKVEKTHANGEMDIRTKAIGLFDMNRFYESAPNKLYAGADILRLKEDISQSDFELNEKILQKVGELFEVLHIKKKAPKNTAQFSVFKIGHHVGLTIEQEYHLLTISSEFERQKYILKHLNALVPMAREIETIRMKAQMNGHFRDLPPIKL